MGNTNDMVASKKRDVAVLGREIKNLRPITLLTSGAKLRIDPSRWVQIRNAKSFDDKNTGILRVSRHKRNEDRFLIYGMRSSLADGAKKADIIAEAYELVASEEQIEPTLAKIAEHCGLVELVKDVK